VTRRQCGLAAGQRHQGPAGPPEKQQQEGIPMGGRSKTVMLA
jgi:hypothetical protein